MVLYYRNCYHGYPNDCHFVIQAIVIVIITMEEKDQGKVQMALLNMHFSSNDYIPFRYFL